MKAKVIKMNLGMVSISLYILAGLAYGEGFPEVGKTYQLDRAQYPGKVAICMTEKAMTDYMEATWANNLFKVNQLLHEINTNNDIETLKTSGGCTLISSFSQAKVIKRGVEAHQAEFFAFPFFPMWGYYLYFGGRVS